MDRKSRGFKKHGNMCKIKNTRLGTKFKYGKKVIKHNKIMSNKKYTSSTARIGIKSLIKKYDDVISKECCINNAKCSIKSSFNANHKNTSHKYEKNKHNHNNHNKQEKQYTEHVDDNETYKRDTIFTSFAQYISSFFF